MFKSFALIASSAVSAQQQITPEALQSLLQLNSMIQPEQFQGSIMNLRQRENQLLNAKMGIQNLVDPVTAMAAIKAGTEAAGEVMDVVERGTALIGQAIEWADKTTDEAADVERIQGILDFVRQE